MKCAWCEGDADAEYVDIGVGQQQVDPGRCRDCGAVQMGGYGEDKADAIPEENRRRWWMGEDTEDFMIHVLETDRWYNAREWIEHLLGIPENDPRAYKLHAYVYVADLMGVVHCAYPEIDGEHVFRTRCGRDLTIAGSGPMPAPTCLACTIRP